MKTNFTLPAAALLLASLSTLRAGSHVAGTLLVDLHAGSYANGSPWNNTGSLGGTFFPAGTTPKRETINGLASVVFDGQDWFAGPAAPATLTGTNPTCTIECWVWNGNTSAFELMAAWGHGAAPNGREIGFSYGEHAEFGAFTHFGTGDGGWDPTLTAGPSLATTPAVGDWHYLVYTCDGTSARAYMDGALMKTVAVTTNVTATPILLGQRTGAAGTPLTAQGFTGALHYARIHSEALGADEVLLNYEEDLQNRTGEARAADALKCGPVHRYSFNYPGTQTTNVHDSAGTAHGTIRGANFAWVGGQLEFPGGSSSTEAYVDLPNGLISGYSDLTLEVWATLRTRQNWSRILDIGSGTAGEVTAPGGAFNAAAANGGKYVMLAACQGTGSRHAMEVSGVPHLHGGPTRASEHNDPGVTHHHVITYSAAQQEWRHYMDGLLVSCIPSASGPATIPDVNVWLGRSNFSTDSNFDGWVDEFRVYACALTDAEVLRNAYDGPDVLTVLPVPCSFREWVMENNPNAAINPAALLAYRTQDWDHDGISNALEYALLPMPGISNNGAPVIAERQLNLPGGGTGWTFTYRRLITLPGVTLVPEITNDLSTWFAPQSVERIAAVDHEDGTITETWRWRDPDDNWGRAFARLREEPGD